MIGNKNVARRRDKSMASEPPIQLAHSYRYAGVYCGIRDDPERLDLAIVVSDTLANAAGVFTQNRIVAAPVWLCKERLPRHDARGIVICSGNANACTGSQGLDDARRMAKLCADEIGCGQEQILVCSTGVIGRLLPMAKVEKGIHAATRELQSDASSLERAARAIWTTDTRLKISTRKLAFEGNEIHITGFAKGAAMIGPNLATMLAFVLTDAAIGSDELQHIAKRAVERSFNCISVEGHTSTNDAVIFLANGNGVPLRGDGLARAEAGICEVCTDLARAMAADAEGATHFVTITVEGLRDDAEARRVAKAIADSALVKTAIFGADPNWGRIVSAAGYAGVDFEEDQLSLWLGDLLLFHAGTPQPFDAATASAYIKNNRDIELRLRFTLGASRCTFWTCDLGYEYVRLNAEYTT
jgi:glutamate N-acetyltransferase/amino-acid N-acetyltransferase